MKKIYFKNFKGFQEHIIELCDINFLVGENSTGKTSFINLVNLLCSQEFWFNYQFNNSEIEFGYFEEILSKISLEKCFQIGTENFNIIGSEKEKHRKQSGFFFSSNPINLYRRLIGSDFH